MRLTDAGLKERLERLHGSVGEPRLAAAILAFRQQLEFQASSAQQLIEFAEALRREGDTRGAAIAAWNCLNDFPEAAAQATVILDQLNEPLPGLLFLDHVAWVTSRACISGGSWLKLPSDFQCLPTAWDGEVLQYFSRLLRDRGASAFLDVGANSGSFALLGLVNSGVECHAVEPNPAIASLLRLHITLNSLDAVTTVHRCALSNTTGKGVLKSPRQTGLATLGDAAHLPDRDDLDVDTFRLDDLVEEHGISRIDAIKIDTEGHELQVLEGAERVIAEWCPVILFEAADEMMTRHGYSRDQLSGFLLERDYTLSDVGTEDMVAFPAHR
jgi:FkbM family methyltransferase